MKNPAIDLYLESTKIWKNELTVLRNILLETALEEELKWNSPCYTYQNKNIILLGEFKDHCVISFLKGSLMVDTENLLSKPGENSQSARFIKFTDVNQILAIKDTIKAYAYEAIEIEKTGLKVVKKAIEEYPIPQELQDLLDHNSALNKAFKALTPGRQRAYLMHFNDAKQSKTRITRIEKYIPRILKGFGFNDCICGLSKRMPTCDGSHKSLDC